MFQSILGAIGMPGKDGLLGSALSKLAAKSPELQAKMDASPQYQGWLNLGQSQGAAVQAMQPPQQPQGQSVWANATQGLPPSMGQMPTNMGYQAPQSGGVQTSSYPSAIPSQGGTLGSVMRSRKQQTAPMGGSSYGGGGLL